jgi:hypothetical protein
LLFYQIIINIHRLLILLFSTLSIFLSIVHILPFSRVSCQALNRISWIYCCGNLLPTIPIQLDDISKYLEERNGGIKAEMGNFCMQFGKTKIWSYFISIVPRAKLGEKQFVASFFTLTLTLKIKAVKWQFASSSL